MKRFFTPLSVALVALCFLPQTMNADCNFTPDLFPGQAADRTEHRVSATVHVGEYGPEGPTNMTTIDPFASSNENVVKVYSQRGYNAQVFFAAVGTAQVTYTENVTRPEICSSLDTIDYTVEKGTPTTYVPGEPYTYAWMPGGSGADSGAGGIGEDGGSGAVTYLLPRIYIKTLNTGTGTPQWNENVSAPGVTYTSSNEAVATISASGVVIKSTGTTILTATLKDNDNWEDATASYTLVVKRNVIMYFNPTTVTDTLSNVHHQPELTIDPAVSPIHWESTDTKTATVDANTGAVTMLNNGTTAIRAIFDGNDEYVARTASYTLNVVRKDPQISFVSDYAHAEPNVPTVPLALNNPYSVPINVWQSSDELTATIETDGSAIHPLKEGTVTIQAFVSGNPIYADAVASYTLYIEKIGVTVLGVEVTSLNADDVLENGKVSYDKALRTLYLDGWNVDVSAMSDDIKNGVIKNEKGHNLTVMLKANSSIIGAQNCITSSGPLYIRSISKKDTLILRADASESAIAVIGGAVKMHEALFYNYGQQCAVQCNHISVTKYGHVFGEALSETGEAIRCQTLEKGEGGIGGIDILTPGVYWDSKHHAFWNGDDKTGKAAKLVEIGKVPMPVSSTAETKIEFTEEVKPEDHDQIVFSEGEEDRYNEEKKEIEVSTDLTEKQIDDALEALVPGSSEWVETLPGTIIFDLPIGKGEIAFECSLLEGYTLDVKEPGKASVSIKPSEGFAILYYDVEEVTRVIVYLRKSESSKPAPRHAPAAKLDEPILSLKSITVTPNKTPTGIDNTNANANANAVKLLRDAQLLIIRDGKTYTVTGQEVK